MSIFSKVWFKVSSFFSLDEQTVIDFIDSAAHLILINGGKVLIDASMAAVVDVDATGVDGKTKHGLAFSDIANVLTREGIPVVVNAVNVAIEMAVAKAKANGSIAPKVS